jgi:hypothetical protein
VLAPVKPQPLLERARVRAKLLQLQVQALAPVKLQPLLERARVKPHRDLELDRAQLPYRVLY